MMIILSNQVHCKNCGESPWSATRHDYVQCGCITVDERVSVDGGMDYIRRVHGPKADYEDISVIISDEHAKGLMVALLDKTRNDLGKLCNIVRYLRDEMDINITEEETG